MIEAMSDYIEAVVALLPSDAGGRVSIVRPRDGSYRPFARHPDDGSLVRVRFIEGPATVAPGDTARVVVEVEAASAVPLRAGTELDLVELGSRPVGLLTVSRVWRAELMI